MIFQKATKRAARLRMALIGPAGSGKTMSALAIGSGLGERIAVLDTERGSASKYADHFAFDVLELESFSPLKYVEAIHAAEAAHYDVLIIDSLSHAWMGKDGALEMVDQAAARSPSRNSFDAWRKVTPLHNQLVDAILAAKMHVIVTMRTKVEWVLEENDKGKKIPRKIGLQPVQRDGLDYEMDITGDLDRENTLFIDKTRCSQLTGKMFPRPGLEVAAIIKEWLTGAPAALPLPATPPPQPVPSAAEEASETLAVIDLRERIAKAGKVEDMPVIATAAKALLTSKAITRAEFDALSSQYRIRKNELAARTPTPPEVAVNEEVPSDTFLELRDLIATTTTAAGARGIANTLEAVRTDLPPGELATLRQLLPPLLTSLDGKTQLADGRAWTTEHGAWMAGIESATHWRAMLTLARSYEGLPRVDGADEALHAQVSAAWRLKWRRLRDGKNGQP